MSGRNSLAVQRLGLCVSTAGGPGSIPGGGTKILYMMWYGQKIKANLKKVSDVLAGASLYTSK